MKKKDDDIIILKPDKKMSNARRKQIGASAELYIQELMQSIGFEFCIRTTKSASLLDHCGIDFNFMPVILQCKGGTQKHIKPADELKYIADQMHAKLPPTSEWLKKPKILVHCKGTSDPRQKKKNVRSEYEDICTMTLNDLVKLLNLIPK